LTFLKQRGSWLYNEKLRKSDYTNSLKEDEYIQLMYLKDKDPFLKDEVKQEKTEDEQKRFKEQTRKLVEDKDFDTFCERFINVEECKKVLFTSISENVLYDCLDGPIQKKNESFPIKLFISIPNEAPKLNKLKDFATKHRIATKFGFVHTGLQIRDKIVHFMRNSFVRIDRFKGQNALFLINISASGRLPCDDKVQTAIATAIVKWNKEAIYNDLYSNCQDFVQYVCNEINKCDLPSNAKISFNFEDNPLVKKYLDYLRQNPHYQKKFFIDSDGIRHVFETHDQLDDWQKKNQYSLSSQDVTFLKGFHRAFQLVEASNLLKEGNKGESDIVEFLESKQDQCVFGNEDFVLNNPNIFSQVVYFQY